MIDDRAKKLIDIIVNYSVRVQQGDKIVVQTHGYDSNFINELMKEIFRAGGYPLLQIKDPVVDRSIVKYGCKEYFDYICENEAYISKRIDGFIGIRFNENLSEANGVDPEQSLVYTKALGCKYDEFYCSPKLRWVGLRYPTQASAQAAGMNTEDYENFFFRACNLNYAMMSKAMDPLVRLMEKTDEVRITGEGTDICFSIKDMGVFKCAGNMNIPDGEVFSAPVLDSVNGTISYNTFSIRGGFKYENIVLRFQNGKIVEATCNDTERINKVFDTDEGARYVGEFAIGVNPYITEPMGDTMFDEKIHGSIHFTPGFTCQECRSNNVSAIHWDLVLIQTPEYGGGEIYFDGRLVRKDGLFVIDELKCLNPDNLM